MRMRLPGIAAAMMSLALVAKPALPPFTTTPSGLQFVDMRAGHGKSPATGQLCSVLYRGWLYNDKQRGQLFDSAQDARKPFRFPLAQGQVIPGWDEGVAGMRVGGRRKITIPPHLGYGSRGAGGVIAPNETLVFVVDLLGVG